MKYYVEINGESSLNIQGLAIQSLPAISKPLMRSKRTEIDGRDGDIITKLGYSAYDKTLKIGLWGNYDINEVIAFFNQEGTITFSNEPDKYYNFTILNREDYINQLEAFREASITIHCQPFKYELNEQPVELENEYVEETGTSLTFENSIVADMDIDLKGNTLQNTLSGKNLLDLSNTQISLGITSDYNKETGAFNFSGKSTTTYSDLTAFIDCNLPIGNYNFSLNKSFSKNFHLILKFNDNSTRDINLVAGNTNISFTTDKVAIQQRIYAALNNNTNYDETFYIQLESGSTATSFERYCGGVPSPNPNYPQPVNNVSGDNDIVVCGKNLINKNNYRLGYYDSSGNWNNANNNATFDLIQVVPNTTYTFSTNANTDNKNFVEFGINKNFISRATTSYNTKFKTITTSQNTYYISAMMNINGQAITQSDIDNLLPQLEQNNETTTYEAYNGTTYNIDLPVENLFDEVWENGGVNSTTGANENNGDTARIRTKNYISVKPSTTYTLTFDGTNISDSGGRLILYDTSKGFINCLWYQASYNGKWTFTTTSSSYYIRFTAKKDSGTWDLTNIKFQLEKGSKSNHYTPYGTKPIELNKIGTYQDYIYKENDKWYLHKEIGKVVLNGSESWTGNGQTEVLYEFYTTSVNKAYGFANFYTNKFEVINGQLTSYYQANGRDNNNRINIRVKTSDLTSYNESALQTWLSNNNVEVVYQLATSTNTEITYTPLIEQLESIKNAMSKQGTTNVNQVNNDAPFIITASVLSGDNSVVVNNNGNIYSKPIMTIYGSGNIGVYLSDSQIFSINLGDEEYITLDTANMEAYKVGVLKNRLVSGDYNSFKLETGNNTISFTGNVEKVEIQNYSRWI